MSRSKKVCQTILAMFSQRGYTDIDQSDEKYIIAKGKDKNSVCAFLNIIEKLNVTEIHNVIAQLQKTEINHGLIVYEGFPTPAVKNVISNTADLNINIELFQADDLQFNITEHKLVPKHILLSKEEAAEFKEKYGVNIPILLHTDAVARFFDFTKGEIIKIIRRDGFVSYRIVR